MTEVMECIFSRRSVREYDDKRVSALGITTIIAAGNYAPSAGDLRNRLFIIMSEHPLKICVCSTPHKKYGVRGEKLYNIQNCAASVQNMLLAAHDLGLGACWVGAFLEEKVIKTFNLKKGVRPQAIITVGYKKEVI